MWIEVVVVRHPDAGTDVSVFVDGVEVRALVTTVDPGAGFSAASWAALGRVALDGHCTAAEGVLTRAFARYADSALLSDDNDD